MSSTALLSNLSLTGEEFDKATKSVFGTGVFNSDGLFNVSLDSRF